ncbi:MAG: riboflavin synthase [Armatimonadetes bacterium]|nr:riboflavin synthase [Armatimonadota bacterium]
MFTGIVQAVSEVSAFEDGRLVVNDPGTWRSDPFRLGESIAVNGCCLTLTCYSEGLAFDLSHETLRRTALCRLSHGGRVNLERALRMEDRLGGHFVQGHVDATGTFLGRRPEGNAFVFRFSVPDDRYIVDKGSVTLDGISLTVVGPTGGEFDVWVIHHTMRHTTLGDLSPGDPVNVEYDMLARYVERLLSRE